jgi:hypothetical protein
MKHFPMVLFTLTLFLPLFGCGANVEEEAPPTTAAEMTPEDKANYEKQMEMMKQNRPQE